MKISVLTFSLCIPETKWSFCDISTADCSLQVVSCLSTSHRAWMNMTLTWASVSERYYATSHAPLYLTTPSPLCATVGQVDMTYRSQNTRNPKHKGDIGCVSKPMCTAWTERLIKEVNNILTSSPPQAETRQRSSTITYFSASDRDVSPFNKQRVCA